MRHILTGLATCALVAVVAACSTTGGSGAGASSTGGTGGTIEGPTWRLASQSAGGTLTDIPAGVAVDARFSGGRVTGSGGCTVYNGPAVISGATIKVGQLATSAMACESPAADVEKAYLANLASAATFTATADSLAIYDASGAAILKYTPGPANALEGEWIVTGYKNGTQAVVGPLAGTTLTATFTADSVFGSSGCNTYNGGYKLDGDKVTIGPLSSTMKACDQAIMDQETQFLAALQTPATVEVAGATVTLRDASGAMQVVLAPKQ